MLTLYWIPFAPARKSYWIGLRFTHKNGDFGAISVTERGCAAPRQSLKWRDAYRIGVDTILDSFCAGMKTIPDRASVYTHKNRDFGAIFVTERSCATPISKVESYIYRIVVHIILDSF